MTAHISELFLSVQGEGIYTGRPAVFVRVMGCNRMCQWCDTKYALRVDSSKAIVSLAAQPLAKAVEDVYDLVQRIDGLVRVSSVIQPLIVWTGGEPAMHQEVLDAVRCMKSLRSEWEFHIETNGSVLHKDLALFSCITVSPKLTSAQTGHDREDIETSERIMKSWPEQVQLKLVVDPYQPLEIEQAALLYHSAARYKIRAVTFTPVAALSSTYDITAAFEKLFHVMGEYISVLSCKGVPDTRFLIQMHKAVWGSKRGV